MLDDPYALSLVGPAWEQLWAELRAIFPDAGLASVGFDPSASTLFSWIAVMPYLTIDAIETTLRGLARAARGSQVALS